MNPAKRKTFGLAHVPLLHHHGLQESLSHVHTESSNDQHGWLLALITRHDDM